MKSKYITHLIFEGCDGVGKDTLSFEVWKQLNFKYRCYVRGEISDYVYAKKYGREIVATQNGLPFLYVVLTASKKHLTRNINKRTYKSEEEHKEELAKIKDNELFLKAADELKHLYHIIVIDVTDLSIERATLRIKSAALKYINSLSNDAEINQFNEMYRKGCARIGSKLTVKGNQPFIDGEMMMADAHLHNGVFETYSNRYPPLSLSYSFAYDFGKIKLIDFEARLIDFVYPINSKVLQRPEVYEYLAVFAKEGKTILTTDSQYLPKTNNMRFMNKVFGNDYITELSKAKATIYTSRDLADLKMITARAYESIIADNIMFVDKLTDKDCEILKQIYGDSKSANWIISLLYVTPETIVQNYNYIMSDKALYLSILQAQRSWYQRLIDDSGVDYNVE